MNGMVMLVLGLLIGWLAEWVIDWYYWRGRIVRLANENTTLREHVKALETERSQRLESSKGVALTDREGRDNFQAIKGIGPVFSRRLHEAGIHTFEQLSQLTPQQLEEILGDLYRRFFSKQEAILAQAREFAKQRAQKS
jgi:predicted flap endonuclease-1-like 5' DNA nuclease